MAHKIVDLVLIRLTRALVVYGCAEIIRFVVQYFVPYAPSVVCKILGLAVGVALVEIAVAYWHQAMRLPK